MEQLCCDLRGENDQLETQVKTGREKMATMEERVREMTEMTEAAGSTSSSGGGGGGGNFCVTHRSKIEQYSGL